MSAPTHLFPATSAASGAEFALALPILLALLFGSVELGNYFMDQHRLVKAVRDGARYAARQDLSYFTGCSGSPGGTVVADTRNVVMTGVLSGGENRLPKNWAGTTITLSVSCMTSTGGQTLAGVYRNVKNSSGTLVGAPIVTVTAKVPYVPVIRAFGFSGNGLNLNASQQAAVIGW